MYKVILILAVVVFSGCTIMNKPASSLIENIPVVKVGESGDVPEEHIVFIPAETAFPVTFSLKGTVFTENSSSEIMTSFKQDVYLYKYWASLDGKNWINSHELMSVRPSGGFDKSGGTVEVKLDLVQ